MNQIDIYSGNLVIFIFFTYIYRFCVFFRSLYLFYIDIALPSSSSNLYSPLCPPTLTTFSVCSSSTSVLYNLPLVHFNLYLLCSIIIPPPNLIFFSFPFSFHLSPTSFPTSCLFVPLLVTELLYHRHHFHLLFSLFIYTSSFLSHYSLLYYWLYHNYQIY